MRNEKSYWRKWYLGVIIVLLLQLVMYYFITVCYQ
jgi:hypothetical protein